MGDVPVAPVKTALIVITLALLSIAPTAQAAPEIYEPKRLTATIYADGYVWIEYEVEANPLLPSIELTPFGRRYEGLIVTSSDGLMLDYNITQNGLVVETLGLTQIKISYYTQDLTNKSGRLWTFTIDAPIDVMVRLPNELTVVGLNKVPLTVSGQGDSIAIVFGSGLLMLNYIVSQTKTTVTQQNQTEWTVWLGSATVVGVGFAAGIVAWIYLKRRRLVSAYEKEKRIIDVEKILVSKPDLRPDDKEVLRFLAEVGGEAFEAELRSRFNLPKTSMWRMVRRLQREGLVDVKKVGGQNLVYIRDVSEIGGGTDVPKNP